MIRTLLLRWLTRIRSLLRYSSVSWELHGLFLAALSIVSPSRRARRLWYASEGYRRAQSTLLKRLLEWRLRRWLTPPASAVWRDDRIGWSRYEAQGLADPRLVKSIILKEPAGAEPGVLYVSFGLNWLRIMEHADLRGILQEYLLIGATSTSPPDYRALWALDHLGARPTFFQVSNLRDLGSYTRLSRDIVEVPLLASDWINPAFYEPIPHEQRDIDIIMVAGWAPVKRHWLLFDALRRMDRSLRVVLIGTDMFRGQAVEDVRRLAGLFEVAERVEFVTDRTPAEVAEFLCRSRVSLVLSRREGSSVVVAESLFADTPVGMMRGAHVGAIDYIGPETGILMNRSTLPHQLARFVSDSAGYSPRQWALEQITCMHATDRLNALLKTWSVEHGLPWTRDIVPMCWRPDPIYVRPEDASRFALAYRQLEDRYGLRFRVRGSQG